MISSIEDPQVKYKNLMLHPVNSELRWREALETLPNRHPLQSWTWGEFKSRWGWSFLPFLLQVHSNPHDEPPQAAAMVLRRRLPKTKFSILYVPKGPILDYNNPQLRRVMLAQLEELARLENAIFVKIDPDVIYAWGLEEENKSPIGHKFIQELRDRGWFFSREQIQFRNTVEIDLSRSEEELLMAMKQKTRYNIRLAKRKGVKVRLNSQKDWTMIANMYLETARRDGFAVRPAEYYLDAWSSLYDAKSAQAFIAEFEGRPLAAVIIVQYGHRAVYMYGASTNIERNRMPAYLLQWEAIRWSKEQGNKIYDMWGAPDKFVDTDPLWGVWRFKDGFQGQVVRHIGAWDYVARPFWYWMYTLIVPRYVNVLRKRNPGNQS